ncbi:MAG: hypothetical protein AB8C46_24315 [Burkholderiaceae bacterium]
MLAPTRLLPYIERFSREILNAAQAPEPFFVNPLPPSDYVARVGQDAFELVAAHVSVAGGNAVNGWAIWERPNLYLEAEFTAIWAPPGEPPVYLPIPGHPAPRMLFLPDPQRKANGDYVDNKRRSLTKDKRVNDYLRLSEHRVAMLRKAGLRNSHQVISKTDEMRRIEHDIRDLLSKINDKYGSWGG